METSFDARVAKAKIVAVNKDIAKYAKEKNLIRAQECFDVAISSGSANSHTYAAMLNAFIRCGQIEEASTLYESLKSNTRGVKLDVISCTTMMKGYSASGDIQSCQRILQDMVNARPKIVPNIRTINTFLRGCVLAGAQREAEDLFPRIQHEFQLEPDISSWEYLVTLRSQGLAIDKILPIIGRLRSDKTVSGGVAAMCVNLSRATALLTDLKLCRKYLTLANQLLESDEELHLTSNSTDAPQSTQVGKQTIGGKQAWKQLEPDDARNQSLEIYQEHRRAELRQEINSISTFISRSDLTINSILPYFKRILLFNHVHVDNFSLTENKKILSVDSLLEALVFSLGYDKALMKNNAASASSSASSTAATLEFDLQRIPQVRDPLLHPPAEKKKKNKMNTKTKSKTKMTKSLLKSISTTSKIKITSTIADRLREMRDYLDGCFTSSPSCHLELGRLFDDENQQLPLKLEICSGFGEWAVKQAIADLGRANWLTLELKQDRVYQTFTRSIYEGASNLAMLCGDAMKVLPMYIPDSKFSNIFVNYPEPPQQLGGDDTQSKHLLTPDFFAIIDRILILDGVFTILTDNLWYGRLLLKIISSNTSGGHLINFELNCPVQESLRGYSLYSGKPGPECGYNVDTTSYFDRLWQRGRQPDRYFLAVKKTQARTLNFGRSTKRSVSQMQVSSTAAPKKIKFTEDED